MTFNKFKFKNKLVVRQSKRARNIISNEDSEQHSTKTAYVFVMLFVAILGSYPLQAGALEVILSDVASGVVIADANNARLANSNPTVKVITNLKRDLSTSSDVTLSVSAANFPENWMVDLVLDGDTAGAIRFNSTLFQHTLTGLSLGEHTIEAIMVDENGTQQSGYSDQVGFGVGEYFVAFGDSITSGDKDNLHRDDISADGRDTGGGYPPVLNDLLTANKGYPHTIVNAGFGGGISYDGQQRITQVIALNPDSQIYLIQFGTNDAGGRVASGMGLSRGDPGYDGTFKDNMQRIIDAVVAAGKTSILAKVPATNYIEPTKTTVNNLIQQYNVVIDELVSTNGITVSPPDFYSYFDTHHKELADAIHPNGEGYRSMAQLWFYALNSAHQHK
jgi:lysophospholipase L1-like esterase